MRTLLFGALFTLSAVLLCPAPVPAADDSKVKAATRQVETGAKKIGDGKILEGVEETAKGIGETVVEGAKFTGEKLQESGKAAEPQAKSAWDNVRDGAVAFGQSVKGFFSRLFSD
ncbi:MAG: hypothetical protein HY727_08340 [Candidatus Rokubacteria bacterium]|nr:hypothetical protein [Candidatus Rokubacteria bacterium]